MSGRVVVVRVQVQLRRTDQIGTRVITEDAICGVDLVFRSSHDEHVGGWNLLDVHQVL